MPNGADNLVLSGGLVPPPRRCARNEKKDKRSLVEKEIDTGACLIDAHSKGVAGAFFGTADSKGVAHLLMVPTPSVTLAPNGKALGRLCSLLYRGAQEPHHPSG